MTTGAQDGDIEWSAGDVPRSRRFDDIYYDPERGAEESAFNFLAGCGLPDGWRRQPGYVIGETGFGTGLNFLVTLDAWRRARPPGHRLHYVSVEAWPLSRAELARAHRAFPALADVSAALLGIYPERPIAGFQRFHLDQDGVIVDLLVGEAEAMLGELEARVDAWFLDGFAPDRNPELWRPEVLAEIARLSDIGTRLGTFTAAGKVRRGLEHAGFAVHRTAGFGQKRERIVAKFDGPTRASALPSWAQLFGKLGVPRLRGRGVAGTCIAGALDRRNLPFVATSTATPRASEVPLALVMPRLSTDESIPGRFFAQAFDHARRAYRAAGLWQETGTLQLARDRETAARFERIAERWPVAEFVTPELGTELAGLPIAHPGLLIRSGGFVKPAAVLRHFPEVQEHDVTGPTIWATGMGLADGPLAELLPLRGYRGQVSLVASHGALTSQRCAVIAGKYLSPPIDGVHMIGSTFDPVDPSRPPTVVDPEDHARNRRKVADALDLDPRLLEIVDGWAGVRAALPDRLPAVGPTPDAAAFRTHFAGLRSSPRVGTMPDPTCNDLVLTGLGARGFTVSPLAAELLVSQWLGEPWPVPRSIALALWPARFLVRALKRREG